MPDERTAPCTSAPSEWMQEAEAAYEVAVTLRSLANDLDVDSQLRDDMLGSAEAWLLRARLRGVGTGPIEAT